MPGVYLSSDGRQVSVSNAALPSVQQLVRHLQGAGSHYTTALINANGELEEWRSHEERLLRDAVEIHSHERQPQPGLNTAAQPDKVVELRQCIRQYVNLAVRLYLDSKDKVLPAMCYVLKQDAPEGSREEPGVLPEIDHPRVADLLSQLPPAPCRIDILVSPVGPLANLDAQEGGATVLLCGRGRSLAHIKHTEWIRSRESLEALKTQHKATEVVLLTKDGQCVLEGLITNIGVIMDTQDWIETDGSHDTQQATGTTGQQHAPLTLVCACEGVLPGLAMRRAVCAASQLGWRVERRPPDLRQRHMWKAAFVCNSLRGLVPMRTLTCLDSSGGEGKDAQSPNDNTSVAWHMRLPVSGDALVLSLADKVAETQRAEGALWGVDSIAWDDKDLTC